MKLKNKSNKWNHPVSTSALIFSASSSLASRMIADCVAPIVEK
jgi:hypothetical protein